MVGGRAVITPAYFLIWYDHYLIEELLPLSFSLRTSPSIQCLAEESV
jgi:hypothetical protein